MHHLIVIVAAIPWAAIGRGLSGILTLVIAGTVAWIAYQQHVVTRQQFRLALFEKRMAVYNTTMAFIANVMQSLKPSIPECIEFVRKTRDHEFLFESEIGDFIDELYKQ